MGGKKAEIGGVGLGLILLDIKLMMACHNVGLGEEKFQSTCVVDILILLPDSCVYVDNRHRKLLSGPLKLGVHLFEERSVAKKQLKNKKALPT